MSVAIIPMSQQYGWAATTSGLVQSSFFWGYTLSQVPGGAMAQLWGGQRVLQAGVAVWSLATAAVPLVRTSTDSLHCLQLPHRLKFRFPFRYALN